MTQDDQTNRHKFCPNCGIEAPTQHSYCGSCGNSLTRPQIQISTPETAHDSSNDAADFGSSLFVDDWEQRQNLDLDHRSNGGTWIPWTLFLIIVIAVAAIFGVPSIWRKVFTSTPVHGNQQTSFVPTSPNPTSANSGNSGNSGPSAAQLQQQQQQFEQQQQLQYENEEISCYNQFGQLVITARNECVGGG